MMTARDSDGSYYPQSPRPSMLKQRSQRYGHAQYPNQYVNGIVLSGPSDSQEKVSHASNEEERKRSSVTGRMDGPDDGKSFFNYAEDGRSTRSLVIRERKRRFTRARLLKTKFMNSKAKNHVVAMLGEFVGTAMFLFFGFSGALIAKMGDVGQPALFNPSVQIYIALSFGISLLVNAWIFFRISGGLFNPAVSLALALVGALTPIRAILVIVTEFCAAAFVSLVISVLYPLKFDVATTVAPGTSVVQGLFIEALCTFELVFTILMLAAEKHKATPMAPIGIGLALLISELSSVFFTGGSLNPARSFGPAIATLSFPSEHWIYYIGPSMGALLAVAFYKTMKILEYEFANPGQDGDERNDPTKNPSHEVARHAEEREIREDALRKAVSGETLYDDGRRSTPDGIAPRRTQMTKNPEDLERGYYGDGNMI